MVVMSPKKHFMNMKNLKIFSKTNKVLKIKFIKCTIILV